MTPKLDDIDRNILRALQEDATQSIDDLSRKIGASKTPIWNRIKKLEASGTIKSRVALLEPDHVRCGNTFIVLVRTHRHDSEWLENFMAVINCMPEITEAHRIAGDVDYILKVQLENTEAYDVFYKTLISKIGIYNVTSHLSMETIKSTTALHF